MTVPTRKFENTGKCSNIKNVAPDTGRVRSFSLYAAAPAKMPQKTLGDAISSVVDPCSNVGLRARVVEEIPRRCCSMPPTLPISWWWAAADTADSPKRCSARSASTVCITRTARLS